MSEPEPDSYTPTQKCFSRVAEYALLLATALYLLVGTSGNFSQRLRDAFIFGISLTLITLFVVGATDRS